MKESLYSLDDVIGQSSVIKWLKITLAKNTYPKVSIYAGPAGVGKTTVAKIVACTLASDEVLPFDVLASQVIGEDHTYENVHLYNMSNLNQEAVLEVRSDLTTALTKNGKKVIILDEAHGMREEAQDTLLTAFEALPDNLYVIICTTELNRIKPALLSRCVRRYFQQLSNSEMKQLIERKLHVKNLHVNVSDSMLNAYLTSYCGRQARAVLNLLDTIPDDSILDISELETFMPIHEPKEILQLIRYLTSGNVISGISIIKDMTLSNSFTDILTDILETIMGSPAKYFSRDEIRYLVDLSRDYMDIIYGFITDILKETNLTKRIVTGWFLHWNTFKPAKPNAGYDKEAVMLEDLKYTEHVQAVTVDSSSEESVASLGQFLNSLQTVE